ncbi:MAG: PorT family protein [Sphingobacteriales bacterium]|nr:MAG: PorT family protein [Sphingobacteriales bacterium]
MTTMKKYVLALGLGLCGAIGAKAQSPFISVIPEIGVQFSNMRAQTNGMESSGELKSGVRAGLAIDMALSNNVSLQPGIFYSKKGYEVEQDLLRNIGNNMYNEHRNTDVTVNYIEFPITLQYKFSKGNTGGLFVGAGPYIGVAIDGDVESTVTRTLANSLSESVAFSSNDERDLRIGDDFGDDIESTDIGLNANLGYQFNNGFMLRGYTGIGLSNLAPNGNSNNSLRNFSFGFTLGYVIK